MKNKKILIVGAGVSGLSAGYYAARAGYDVTILEQHSTFGGLSTAWSRKGYYFEGGMHWLTGSSPKLNLNKVWKQVGALKDNNPIEMRDPFYTVINGDKRLYMYRDIKKLTKELLNYAPEDTKAIKRLCKDVAHFKNVHLVVNPKFGELMRMVPAITRVFPLMKISAIDYINRFKNPDIRHLLLSIVGYRYNALAFIYTMGSFASGDCGYPEGGSIRMVKNMEETYLSIGGKIKYRTKVSKVVVENGKVTGVQTEKDGFIPCDSVIVTQDTRNAIDTLFEKPLEGEWTTKMRKNVVGEQNMFVCLGVKAKIDRLPYGCIFPLDKPLEYAGVKFTELRVNNYSKYSDHAPEGCTAITCVMMGDTYDFWKAAKDDGTYKDKKKEFGELFINTLSQFIPEIKDNVEVVDVATPCTYERYCSSYKGSWMSVWSTENKQDNYPQTLKQIKGLYFAGERIMMPGGLPLAVYTGRTSVQALCKNDGVKFDNRL